MREFIDVTGKTEEEAINKALAQLGMDRDDVSVQINDDHILRRHAVIRHARRLYHDKPAFPVDTGDVAPCECHKAILRQQKICPKNFLFQLFKHIASPFLLNRCCSPSLSPAQRAYR